MKLKKAINDFEIQYAEVWLNDYDPMIQCGLYTAGRTEDMSLNQLAKKFPNAEGIISFSLEKGGFTFRGNAD